MYVFSMLKFVASTVHVRLMDLVTTAIREIHCRITPSEGSQGRANYFSLVLKWVSI